MSRKKRSVKSSEELPVSEEVRGMETSLPEGHEEASKEPNIRYVGKTRKVDPKTGRRLRGPVPDDRVPRLRRNGSKLIELPDGATQKKGFYHEDADFLKMAYPNDFKNPVRKGEA